jgi:hypothetical protein
MGVWQKVAMDSLKFHVSPPCPTLLGPGGWPPLNLPYSHFRGGPLTGQAACGRLLPLWTPHAVRIWVHGEGTCHKFNVLQSPRERWEECNNPVGVSYRFLV